MKISPISPDHLHRHHFLHTEISDARYRPTRAKFAAGYFLNHQINHNGDKTSGHRR